MNTNRGIFDSFPNPTADPKDSPFAIATDPAETAGAKSPFSAVASPFTAVARQQDSPFSVADGSVAVKPDTAAATKQPESGKSDSPFQVAEPSEGFGFEATSATPASSPLEAVSAATAAPATSPLASDSAKGASAATQAAIGAFSSWKDTPAAAAAPVTTATAAIEQTAPKPAVTPAPVAAASYSDPFGDPLSDSFSIRQLELRAIFGVDREMTTEEILQRTRALPGIRNIARVSAQDMGTIEGLKNLLPNLGFGSGGLKLYLGSVPLEFIREGSVLFAVQTDGGFAPGVRETLMLVARELSRSA